MTTATLPTWCDPTISREERIAAVELPSERKVVSPLQPCNCSGSFVEFTQVRDRYGLPSLLAKCQECSVCWLDLRRCAEWYANFYSSGTYRKLVSAYHGRDVMATIQEEQHQYADRLWARLRAHAWPYSVLDIGSSTGMVSGFWQDCEPNCCVTLVDPAAEASDCCRPTMLVNAAFEEAKIHGKYEMVLLCQTIDHLLEPQSCLEKIRGLLAKDGLFFMDILDTEQEVAQKGWQQTLKIDHPFYFTDKSARLLLDTAGFEIVDSWESAKHHIGYLCKGRA